MERSSNQSGSSSRTRSNIALGNLYKTVFHENIYNNCVLRNLEEDGFITLDEKVRELLKNLAEPKYLYALKLLFENPTNQFSSTILQDSLKALADPTSFDPELYTKQSLNRLELHLRTWAAVLEQICFAEIEIRLSKKLRDRVYNSLAKFAEIYRTTTRVMEEGLENNFKKRLNLNQRGRNMIERHNYNIDYLLIHLRDTLHSLRDDETWIQELMRRTKEALKAVLNIAPTILKGCTFSSVPSILSMINHLHQASSFKYPIASYYVDWRIMLIIQHNLFIWSESPEKIISKKFGEMALMEYLWYYLDREWNNAVGKSILDSQTKFEEALNTVVKALWNTRSYLNNLAGNEPLAIPNTLWFGILDLAQNLIQKSTRKETYSLCYLLAIESLNKAPNSFIQFKSIEILLHLRNIDDQDLFSIVESDFNHYSKTLEENNSPNSLKKFQNLLAFVEEKCHEDFNILNDNNNIRKDKGKRSFNRNTNSKRSAIISFIANDITCPISLGPVDQLCVLKCQHGLSLINLQQLVHKVCPKCRETIEDNDIRYLPQNTIYKNLHSQFLEAGNTLSSNNSDQITNDSDSVNSDNSDLMVPKKKNTIYKNLHSQFLEAGNTLSSNNSDQITNDSDLVNSENSDLMVFKKENNNRLVRAKSISNFIFQRPKNDPMYQSAIQELDKKNYKKAEYYCKEFLKNVPKSYSIRCILAFIHRCLNNYEQAHFYLDEAIKLSEKNPISWYLYGEIKFRQSNYDEAIENLKTSIRYKAKTNNLYIMLGNSYLIADFYDKEFNYNEALKNFNIALQIDPNNYLCIKNSAYIYEKQEKYLNGSDMLDKLLSINRKDSLILCYYGEILCNMGRYRDAILYFNEANVIDPENVHNLIKRGIANYVCQKYDEALLDLNGAIKLDSSNNLAYYYQGLTYYAMKNINNAMLAFEKCTKLDPNDNLAKMQFYYLKCLMDKNSFEDNVISKFSNINNDKSLLFIRCKIYIELKKYNKAKLDLDRLFELYNDDVSFVHLLRKEEYSDFWSYLYKICKIDSSDYPEHAIADRFDIYMYKEKKVYFVSNIAVWNSYSQKSNSNSLSGKVISFKNVPFNLPLPKFINISKHSKYYDIVWKINVKKVSKDCIVKFIIEEEDMPKQEYISKYEDLSKLEGLGWIEYTPFNVYLDSSKWIQTSIEADNGPINIQIEYIQFKQFNKNNGKKIYFPKMGHLLPIHKLQPNVPEAFRDKYFLRRNMENLLELKDIIS